MNALPIITLEQLAEHHAKAETQWIAIHGKVLDITNFQFQHPGGRNAVLEHAGKDATEDFEDMGCGHKIDALPMFESLLVGIIKN